MLVFNFSVLMVSSYGKRAGYISLEATLCEKLFLFTIYVLVTYLVWKIGERHLNIGSWPTLSDHHFHISNSLTFAQPRRTNVVQYTFYSMDQFNCRDLEQRPEVEKIIIKFTIEEWTMNLMLNRLNGSRIVNIFKTSSFVAHYIRSITRELFSAV